MQQIPDAPWIREAELYGVPESPAPVCPVCGEECETYYIQDRAVIGCDRCVRCKDADEWNSEENNT